MWLSAVLSADEKGTSRGKEAVVGSEKWWSLLLGLLVLAAYIVPYKWLGQVRAWYGAGFFWALFALVVILLLVRFTTGWKEPPKGV